jgi:DUF971 family protein/molybdopterin converting factor small subunit
MPTPIDIKLHQKSRILEISFDDGARFDLPCEYLRVFSPAAEVRVAEAQGHLVVDKQDVNITAITPVGQYAIQLHFDDGHDSGIYAWQTLYDLGQNRERNWSNYLRRRQDTSTRDAVGKPSAAGRKRCVRLLYFVDLADAFGRQSETAELPPGVSDVGSLLRWLKARGDPWQTALSENELKITVNKQFAQAETQLREGDEVALVPGRSG